MTTDVPVQTSSLREPTRGPSDLSVQKCKTDRNVFSEYSE